jgi:hypothetical protein
MKKDMYAHVVRTSNSPSPVSRIPFPIINLGTSGGRYHHAVCCVYDTVGLVSITVPPLFDRCFHYRFNMNIPLPWHGVNAVCCGLQTWEIISERFIPGLWFAP